MARLPLDTMPQQRLIYELRRAIDVARNSSESSVAWEAAVARIVTLCRENPTSTLRAHVLHNLGCTRRHWLRRLSTTLRSSNTEIALHLDLMGKCDRRAVPIPRESQVT
jgi:hypothetical protein